MTDEPRELQGPPPAAPPAPGPAPTPSSDRAAAADGVSDADCAPAADGVSAAGLAPAADGASAIDRAEAVQASAGGAPATEALTVDGASAADPAPAGPHAAGPPSAHVPPVAAPAAPDRSPAQGAAPAAAHPAPAAAHPAPAAAHPAPAAAHPGPADAARRALRAALERGAPEPDPGRTRKRTPGTRRPPGDGPARPGDAARAALRRGPHRTEPEQEPSASAAPPGPVPPGVQPLPGSPTGAGHPARPDDLSRPGDAARAALRAARAEQRAASEAAPDGTAGSDPGAAVTPAPRRKPAPAPGTRRSADPAPPPAAPQPGPGPVTPADRTPTRPPRPPAAPPTMATPRRDHDLRRTFPALAPVSGGSGPAASWWGGAWVRALEDGALDVARLARGRGYAERGHVDAITVTPGLVLAYVQGSRPRPYRVQIRVRTLDDADWERFLDAAAEQPAHIAALLDGELPPSLAETGTSLLPGPGDLEPRCSCPDSGRPCKHAAALCYQTARLLDTDPFVLLLLRGRGERALLDALSRRSAARSVRAAREGDPAALPGVRASEVLARRERPPLPAPLPPPAHPEQPPAYPAAPGGPDPLALDQLATDAAARAHRLLATGEDPMAGLTLWHDAVRLAAARPGSGLTAGTRALYASLSAAAGRTPAELARAVAAWRQGGPDGLAALEEPWDPPAGRFDRARPLLLAADLPAFRPARNRLTHPGGHLQLRLGRDHLWYAYESEPGADDWWPRGTPDHDPVGALTGLYTPAP